MQDASREKSKKTRKTFQTQNFLKFFLQKFFFAKNAKNEKSS